MRIGVPQEIHPGERRVAATPQTVIRLLRMGFEVWTQAGAGEQAGFSDAAYTEAGATVVPDVRALWAESDIVLKVRAPADNPELGLHEAEMLREGACLIGFIWPAQNDALLARLVARRATVLAMDCIPRITRAQKMDALSSMANIAGYRAVVEAAHVFPRFLGGQITAAGRIDPAKVLVIGAGVAGLAAIAAAKAMGAVVRAFDTRHEVKEQVQSLGAEFLEVHVREAGEGEGGYAKEMSKEYLQAETAMLASQAMEVDIIITTALIPGKPAPELVTAGMVESMAEGSVIVDLAAERGGNCPLTIPGEIVRHAGKTIIGYTDLPSRMARQSSQLYGTNLVHLLTELGGAENFRIDLEDEITRAALVTHEGNITWPPPKPVRRDSAAEPRAPEQTTKPQPQAHGKPHGKARKRANAMPWLLGAGAALLAIGMVAPPTFLAHFTVFVLACFVGWQVIWNVTPALHTPLISVTNAISGIIIIGGMLQLTADKSALSATAVLGAIAVLIATINIAGGFLVTNRMLAMFRRHA
jgi:H+-translocating NAD(P) transhydrogenase subunit alpha